MDLGIVMIFRMTFCGVVTLACAYCIHESLHDG